MAAAANDPGAASGRARSSLLRRASRHASSVVAALAALAPRLVRLARHDYPDGLLAKRRNHVLPEQLDRPGHLVGRDVVRLHQAEELVTARLAVALHLPDAGLGVAHDAGVHVVQEREGDVAQVERAQHARVVVAAELAPLLP